MKNYLVTLIIVLISSSAFSAVKKQFLPLSVDGNNKTIVFQTKMQKMKIESKTHHIRYFISKIKKNKFSYGVADYQCNSKNLCKPIQFLHIRYYSSCNGFDQRGRPNCDTDENSNYEKRDHHLDQFSEYAHDESSWYKCDDWDSNCVKQKSLYDEPERYTDSNYIDSSDDGLF